MCKFGEVIREDSYSAMLLVMLFICIINKNCILIACKIYCEHSARQFLPHLNYTYRSSNLVRQIERKRAIAIYSNENVTYFYIYSVLYALLFCII